MLTVFQTTCNRSRILSKSLEALSRLQAPSFGWKLVVIDNGSTDDTREVVRAFRHRLPLTYLNEPIPGKNAALNTGLTQLEGDLAVFTDDDVLPRPDWLVQLRRAADRLPQFDLFGGVIVPQWEVKPTEWASYVPPAPFFSLTDPSMSEGPMDAGLLFGPNLAIRAAIFKQGARFDERVGPRGTSYPMGGETELVSRLQQQGCKSWHVKDAVVEHFIRGCQVERPWLLSRATRFGRGQYRLARWKGTPGFPGLPLMAFYAGRRMCRRLFRMALARLKSNQQELFLARLEYNYNWGLLFEAFRMSRERLPKREVRNQGGFSPGSSEMEVFSMLRYPWANRPSLPGSREEVDVDLSLHAG